MFCDSPQGVLVNATSDFGGFNAMNYLDPSLKVLEPYMAVLVAHFETVSGVKYKGHSLIKQLRPVFVLI